MHCFQPVSWSRKLLLAHGVVCGMEYLHSIQPHPVIHGDLKTQNVLIGDDLVAKVSVDQKSTLLLIMMSSRLLINFGVYFSIRQQTILSVL